MTGQIFRGGKDGGQRMTRAVVAGIHDHKLAFQTVRFTKKRAPSLVKPDFGIERPRRYHGDFSGGNPLRQNPLLHEIIQNHDRRSLFKAEA